MNEFDREVAARLESNGSNDALKKSAEAFMLSSVPAKYSYNFSWLGRPIIQYPQDMAAVQEILWSVKPDLVIETGIAHGGSLIFSASMLELNAVCGGPADAEVLGIDIDIRRHNREAIERHPMFRRISMIEGSSIAHEVVEQVNAKAARKRRVVVCLDSNHTHDHVLHELRAYAPLTSVGSYCIVFDTIVEEMPVGMYPDRPWGPGNSPGSAVHQYIEAHPEFEIDRTIAHKLLISVSPGGYLRRIR
jgi:cephalosporin hydroxylase